MRQIEMAMAATSHTRSRRGALHVLVLVSALQCLLALTAHAQRSGTSADTSTVSLAGDPVVIAPGTVSTTMAEFGGTQTPDGRMMLFVVTDRLFSRMTVVQTVRRGDRWQRPEVASFSGRWNDADPVVAPDGQFLIFMSNRPLPGEPAEQARHDFNLWRVMRRGSTWSAPLPLPAPINTEASEVAPSLAASGALYFGRSGHIFRSLPVGDGFAPPEALPMIGSNASISPDERFLIFAGAGRRQGDVDLYIACHAVGGWSAPRRLGEPVNSPSIEGDPVISADGRTLIFASERGAPASAAWPRPRPAKFKDLEAEARRNIFNGSRNLYEVGIPASVCS
jgi:hypothetical protein